MLRFDFRGSQQQNQQNKHCEIKRIIAVDYKDDDHKVLHIFKYRSNAKN